ncbi:WD40 repeat domain-containing protein [Novosphingobium terrae]|uniref:WD40 repeat domain-containing protein n=1 Tax=Novosphingobium terrae TaxID=2726189 RepID=UPI0019814678|nr:hypothetical protein [Novosphingobium terrae]
MKKAGTIGIFGVASALMIPLIGATMGAQNASQDSIFVKSENFGDLEVISKIKNRYGKNFDFLDWRGSGGRLVALSSNGERVDIFQNEKLSTYSGFEISQFSVLQNSAYLAEGGEIVALTSEANSDRSAVINRIAMFEVREPHKKRFVASHALVEDPRISVYHFAISTGLQRLALLERHALTKDEITNRKKLWSIRVISPTDGSKISDIDLDELKSYGYPQSLDISPDGRNLVVGTDKGWITIYDATTGRAQKRARAYPQGGKACAQVKFSPDGKFVAVSPAVNAIAPREAAGQSNGDEDSLVDIWRTGDLGHVNSLYGRQRNGSSTQSLSLAWDGSGSKIAMSSTTSVSAWQAVTRRPELILTRTVPISASGMAKYAVSSVSFSPKGHLAIAVGDEIIVYQ